jgi:hypothetical protein
MLLDAAERGKLCYWHPVPALKMFGHCGIAKPAALLLGMQTYHMPCDSFTQMHFHLDRLWLSKHAAVK